MSGRTRLWILIGAVAVVVAVVVAGAIVASRGEAEPTAGADLPGAADTRALLRGIPQDGTSLGAADAPVTLVEFADLQCPFCAQWATGALPVVVRDYVRPGKVRLEFRGLAFIGPDSDTALRAALAAGQQDRLWHAVELLYANQGQENTGWVDDDMLSAVATSAGLDAATWRSAFSSAQVEDAMKAASASATQEGVDSTPTFLVGPTGGTLKRVDVASLDAEGIRPALDEALAAAR